MRSGSPAESSAVSAASVAACRPSQRVAARPRYSRPLCYIWEFPKIRGTLFGSPYNKDPTIWGTIVGSPIFGNSHMGSFAVPAPVFLFRNVGVLSPLLPESIVRCPPLLRRPCPRQSRPVHFLGRRPPSCGTSLSRSVARPLPAVTLRAANLLQPETCNFRPEL